MPHLPRGKTSRCALVRMRRFTRPADASSERFENHRHALALYFVWHYSAASIRRLRYFGSGGHALSTCLAGTFCRELSVPLGVILSGVTREGLYSDPIRLWREELARRLGAKTWRGRGHVED